MISVTLCLRLVKDETAEKSGVVPKFANRTYMRFVEGLLRSTQLDEETLQEFCTKYVNRYYDLQFYFLQNAGYTLSRMFLQSRRIVQNASTPVVHQRLHSFLSSLIPLLPSDDSIPEMFTSLDQKTSILLPSSYKVVFQTVWLTHLRHPVEPTQLKQLLLIVHKRIIPYMNKPQLLMDWLTDSYNTGCDSMDDSDNRWKHVSSRFEWFMGVNAKV